MNNLKKKKVFVTEERFNLAKTLEEAGLPIALICQATTLSEQSVYRVGRAKDYAEYRQQRRAEHDRQEKAKFAKSMLYEQATAVEEAEEDKPTVFVSQYATKEDIQSIHDHLNDIQTILTNFTTTQTVPPVVVKKGLFR